MIEAALALAAERPVPQPLGDVFEQLAGGHRTAVRRSASGPIGRRSISPRRSCSTGREGEVFDAVVTDEDQRGVQFQIAEPAIVARVAAHRVDPGDPVRVRLMRADPVTRTVEFVRVS